MGARGRLTLLGATVAALFVAAALTLGHTPETPREPIGLGALTPLAAMTLAHTVVAWHARRRLRRTRMSAFGPLGA